MPKSFSDLQLLISLSTAIHFFLLGWFHSLFAAFLRSYPIALASLTYCLQSIPGFTFTTLCNGLSEPPYRGTPAIQLASATLLSLRGRFLDSKARTKWPKLPSSVCWSWNMFSSFKYIFTSFLYSMVSFTACLERLACHGTSSTNQADLELRDLHASV